MAPPPVDRVRRGLCFSGRLEGPVFLVAGPLFDPLAQQSLLGFSDRLVGFRWWHDRIRIAGLQSLPEFARVEVARPDGHTAVFVGGEGPFCRVEAQARLAFLGIEPMTREAIVREDGADVPIEGQVGRQGRNGREARHHRNPPECSLNHAVGNHA